MSLICTCVLIRAHKNNIAIENHVNGMYKMEKKIVKRINKC